jgi:hypothetical protein
MLSQNLRQLDRLCPTEFAWSDEEEARSHSYTHRHRTRRSRPESPQQKSAVGQRHNLYSIQQCDSSVICFPLSIYLKSIALFSKMRTPIGERRSPLPQDFSASANNLSRKIVKTVQSNALKASGLEKLGNSKLNFQWEFP